MSRVEEILKDYGMEHIDQNWLEECVGYIRDNFNEISDQEFSRQLLYSDLAELVSYSTLPSIMNQSKVIVNKPLMVQIVDILEIGTSGQEQVELIRLSKPVPRKVLKFILSDGIQRVRDF
jgi:hypothetical protein